MQVGLLGLFLTGLKDLLGKFNRSISLLLKVFILDRKVYQLFRTMKITAEQTWINVGELNIVYLALTINT